MPLEETVSAMRETLRKRRIWLDAGHWSMECENEVAYLTSALHHLEAGKRAQERLEQIHQLAVYPADCATDLNCDPDREFKLRERIADLSFSATTEEPQG
jgi:hypothetical protein